MTNPGSLKELIPEFYEDNVEFLLNLQNLDLGLSNKNQKIDVSSNKLLNEECNTPKVVF